MSIENKVKELFPSNPRLVALVESQTKLGLEKYGQRLDDNDKPLEARQVHALQECIDLLQYLFWILEVDNQNLFGIHVMKRAIREVAEAAIFLDRRTPEGASLGHKEGYHE
jgi:hypothetical protein